ncbi:terpenoid synthase [Rhodocollybia butyracea]|uniref:Terpenoid synthase n=1 Tax=Rhodocollybia butyracea TaxID=206335 RepID=A0A9P5PCH5_9AGAR|nr:terpenoid synthase [Rhodocollybia butyracea]
MTGNSSSSDILSSVRLEKNISKDYIPRLQLLLHELDYRYVAPPSPSPSMNFFLAHHEWIHDTVGPMTSWTTSQLDVLEDSSSALIERSYPSADTEMKVILAKLTALAIFLDDSVENDVMYEEIGNFAHHLHIGESQSSGILKLYHECIKELSHLHEGDAVLRGLAVMPWINFVDGCLLEKRLLTLDTELRASPYDMGYQHLAKQRRDGISHVARETSPGAKIHFPLFIRNRTGISEAYTAAIFKCTKEQGLPLSRYVMALPDISFYIMAINDLLSFHKEELAGETVNLIHLRTQALKENKGTSASGEWTVLDTFNLLCNEVREAANRIDEIVRLQDIETMMRDRSYGRDMGLSEVDVTIALQWREFRDGYISWHLESQRYKLDFIRREQFQPTWI